jgi:glycosyltransferase involved in cell wall biosynthesis
MFIYIVPAHNESETLPSTMRRIDQVRSKYGIDRIVAVENGSSDATWCVLQNAAVGLPYLHAFSEPAAGLGHAYHRGIEEALRLTGPSDTTYLVLTACDLPFGFTDIEGMLALPSRPLVTIGSKAKLVGAIAPDLKRRTMSRVYQLARRWLIGMQTLDCQGSFVVRSDVAHQVYRAIRARDFFYTTELCARLERLGILPIEVAVEIQQEVRPSTVRPLKHGTAMLRQLVALRRELARGRDRGARR